MKPPRRERRAFVWRRLHSLTGVLPAGVFLTLHLCTNLRALRGQQAFDAAVAGYGELPFFTVIECVGLFLPLFYHAGYGLYRVSSSRSNVGSYPYSRNWAYLTMRASGVVLLVFLLFHLWQFRLPRLLGQMNRSDYFDELCAGLAGTGALGVPWLAIGFLIALLAAASHLGNGLASFGATWGITASLRASRKASVVCGLFGAVAFVLGASTVLYFATGMRFGVEEVVEPVWSAGQEESDSQPDLPGPSPLGTASTSVGLGAAGRESKP